MTSGPLLFALILLLRSCHALPLSSGRKAPAPDVPMCTDDRVVISQRSNGQCKIFSFGDAARLPESESQSVPTLQRVRSALRSTFFPTVAADILDDGESNDHQMGALSRMGYLKYILFDNIQDLSTTLRGVLVTHRVLKRVGVGRSGATALAATLHFLVRDFCGILSSLLFTSLAANSFRRDVKRWKFLSAIMLDISLTLQIVASSMNGLFLPLLCLGSICQAMYNVAASPCTGVIKLHWAIKLQGTGDGIAEISAKRRAQRTLMDLVGLLLAGIGSVRLDGIHSKGLRVCLYCGLTALHLASSNRSLRLVELDWMNGWRLHRIVEEFVESVDVDQDGHRGEARGRVRVSTPVEISRAEPLLFLPGSRNGMHRSIRMGVSFDAIAQLSHEPPSLLRSNLRKRQGSSRDRYILAAGHDKGAPRVAVAFFSHITNRDTAKAYLHGCLAWRALKSLSRSHHCDATEEPELLRKAEDIAGRKLAQWWPLFEVCASDAGWKLDQTECSSEGYRVM